MSDAIEIDFVTIWLKFCHEHASTMCSSVAKDYRRRKNRWYPWGTAPPTRAPCSIAQLSPLCHSDMELCLVAAPPRRMSGAVFAPIGANRRSRERFAPIGANTAPFWRELCAAVCKHPACAHTLAATPSVIFCHGGAHRARRLLCRRRHIARASKKKKLHANRYRRYMNRYHLYMFIYITRWRF